MSAWKSILTAGVVATVAVVAGCRERRTANTALPVIQAAPQFELLNQDNQTIRLGDLQGKIKVLSFFYVRCHLAAQCPQTTKNLAAARAALSARDRNNVVFLMISFDADRDTPGAIKKYGELYGAASTNWHFLTGSTGAVDKVCADYQFIHEKQADETIRHSLITFLIDGENNIRKMYFANAWKPDALVGDILSIKGDLK